MSRKVAPGRAFRAILWFVAPAHERSQQRRDESKKCPSRADAWTLFQIAWTKPESRPRPPNICIEIQDHSRAAHFHLGHTAIDVGLQKMDVNGDDGRRELELRGQRPGTESDKGTAANSLSGYHAPGLKKILAYLRP
jgi:hypothetical protein